ncbi:GNAT family N-acetyltransferase [Nocardiopsis suaedae]|uniref:GNAT family N-acetyltransferase n=1 Tax=Nocardiopsis suaedae TaxID=3018444 RepID=A0ABT4TQ07_9ACTN|nr:GNAT family N-acetyltransferase [Nocardiopsis suaedae]MDA2806771.1 GNAT family N-acetyltransferase [Nocardiopsis suaedae]
MTTRLATRSVRAADAESLVPLFAALSHPATPAQLRSRLERLAGDPAYEAWGVESETAQLVGFAAGHLLFPIEDDVPAAQLIALVAAGNARGRGVGTALCTAFEQWARGQGAARALLNSSSTRGGAHAFYTRRGYTASGVRFTKPL